MRKDYEKYNWWNYEGDILNCIDLYNDAVKARDLKCILNFVHKLQTAEQQYAKSYETFLYNELKNEEKPMEVAIKQYSYRVWTHSPFRKNAQYVQAEAITKTKKINLAKFTKYINYSTTWMTMSQELDKMIALKIILDFNLPSEKFEHKLNDLHLNSEYEKLNTGKISVSNTQLNRLLQNIIDELCFCENGKGKNSNKINSRDLHYLIYRNKNRIYFSKRLVHKTIYSDIMDIAHRILTNKKYSFNGEFLTDTNAVPLKIQK